jgi:hypothetical protein
MENAKIAIEDGRVRRALEGSPWLTQGEVEGVMTLLYKKLHQIRKIIREENQKETSCQ